MRLRPDLHDMLLEQLGYGELLSVRCFKSRPFILLIINSIRLLPLILNAESCTASLQKARRLNCMRSFEAVFSISPIFQGLTPD